MIASDVTDTRGLADNVLTTAERGYAMTWLDEYPNIINAITLEQVRENLQTIFRRSLAQVNSAIRKYVKLDALVSVVAGTVDESMLKSNL